ALERRRPARSAAIPTPPAPDEPSPAPTPPEEPDIHTTRSGDVMRIGSDIHIENGQVVEGDVFALQGDIRVDGHVKGNVASSGGDVYLGSTARVDGDVLCIGGQLHEENGASVGGQRVTALHGTRDRRIRHRIRERLRDMDIEGEVEHRTGELVGSIIW